MDKRDLFEANALIESITDSKTAFFEAAEASRLMALLPVTPAKSGFSLSLPWISNIFNAYSPGIGNVGLKDDKKNKEFKFNQPVVYRVGGYNVIHNTGEMLIEHMWAHTREDATGQSCLLSYDEATKAPEKLELAVDKTYEFLFFSYVSQDWQPWKTPKAPTP